jgi:hypothetical protein
LRIITGLAEWPVLRAVGLNEPVNFIFEVQLVFDFELFLEAFDFRLERLIFLRVSRDRQRL